MMGKKTVNEYQEKGREDNIEEKDTLRLRFFFHFWYTCIRNFQGWRGGEGFFAWRYYSIMIKLLPSQYPFLGDFSGKLSSPLGRQQKSMRKLEETSRCCRIM